MKNLHFLIIGKNDEIPAILKRSIDGPLKNEVYSLYPEYKPL